MNRTLELFIAAALAGHVLAVDSFADNGKPRNVILFVGDGMGMPQLGLLNLYFERAADRANRGNIAKLAASSKTAFISSSPSEYLINDSACAATQYASGKNCLPGVLGFDERGERVELAAERLQKDGKSIGLVSDTRITHATPAGFAVHIPHRDDENEVADALLTSGVNVLLSGGLRHFLPSGGASPIEQPCVSLRADKRDLTAEARAKGYTVVYTKAKLDAARGNVLGLFSCSGMKDGISESAYRADEFRTYPTLRDLAVRALSLLERNEKGFFLMVEAGQIDWMSHANDAGATLHEMLRFDDTLGALMDYVERNSDTVLLVTADHETGGLSLSYVAEPGGAPTSTPHGAFAHDHYEPGFGFLPVSALEKLHAQKQTFNSLFKTFNALPKTQQTKATLGAMIEKMTGFRLRNDELTLLLTRRKNRFFRAGHKDLGIREGPDLGDSALFYPYVKENQAPLLGRMLGKRLGVSWGTGTHTHSPVPLFVFGAAGYAEPFSGFLRSEQFGEKLRALTSP